jgi:hypothetical protein
MNTEGIFRLPPFAARRPALFTLVW